MSRKRRAAARVSPVDARDVGQRELGVVLVERADDREAALERLHEVRRAAAPRPQTAKKTVSSGPWRWTSNR